MKRAKRPKAAKARAPKARVVASPEKASPESQEDLELRKPEPKRRVISRPDGFYWQSLDGREEAGPFTSRSEAAENMLVGSIGGTQLEEGESLQEAESELGISEWIDPDTGGPAEDSVPRIEDH